MSQIQINQRARMEVTGGLGSMGLAPDSLLGEAPEEGSLSVVWKPFNNL